MLHALLSVHIAPHLQLQLSQLQAVLTRDPPSELEDHYSADHIKTTRAYSIDKKNFALVKGAFDFAESLAVLCLFLLPWSWQLAEKAVAKARPAWAGNEYVVSIAFVLLSAGFDTVKGVPWSLYSTFVIESRHGFNKQTLGLFFSDLVKSVRHCDVWRACQLCTWSHVTHWRAPSLQACQGPA